MPSPSSRASDGSVRVTEGGPGKFSRGKTIHVNEAELQAHLDGLPSETGADALVVERASMPPPLPRRRPQRTVLILGVCAVVAVGVALGVGAGYWIGLFDRPEETPAVVAPVGPAPDSVAPIALDAVRVELGDSDDPDTDAAE